MKNLIRLIGGILLATVLGTGAAFSADAPEKKNVLSTMDVQIYGYTRLDAIFDTSRVFPGNYFLYVKSEPAYNDDNQINLTANQTRLGLNLSGPEFSGGKAGGKLEVDFYGAGGTENKSNLMMRQAYMELLWAEWDVSLLAGQAWDIVSPLMPDTINYCVNEGSGELGYRRPQLRLTKNLALTDKAKLGGKLALTRNLGHTVALTSTDSGTDSGLPAVQAALAFTGPLWGEAPAVLGISGVWGREEYDINAQNVDPKIYPSWGVSVDLQLPIVAGAGLKANVWRGANLETYMGGFGQGINTATGESVHTQGGWVSVGLGPWVSTKFNLGGSIETNQWDQVPNGWRFQNSAIFANGIYSLTANIQLALEVAQLRSLYKEAAAGDAVRVQTAFIYNF
jgi:hypothetical protein